MLRTINIVNLRQKKNIFKSVACIIHDLTVSKATFERDFDLHMTNIQNAIQNAKDIDYEKYKCRITKWRIEKKDIADKVKVSDICKKCGITKPTFYRYKKKYDA